MPTIYNDAPLPWQLGFQDSATPIHEGIVELHDTIMYYLIIICVLVFWMLTSVLATFGPNRIADTHSSHGTLIELLWTITPALVLLAIALPSFRLLYLMDEIVFPGLTLKVVGQSGLKYTTNKRLEVNQFWSKVRIFGTKFIRSFNRIVGLSQRMIKKY